MKNGINYILLILFISLVFLAYIRYRESTKTMIPLTLEEKKKIHSYEETITEESILQAICELRGVKSIKIVNSKYIRDEMISYPFNPFKQYKSIKNQITTISQNQDFEEVKKFNIEIGNTSKMDSFIFLLRYNYHKFSLFKNKEYPYINIFIYKNKKEKFKISIALANRIKESSLLNYTYSYEIHEYKAIKRKYPIK